MLNARSAQITEDLGDVFVRQGLGRFQLDDQAVVHKQVGVVIADERAVLVIAFERGLHECRMRSHALPEIFRSIWLVCGFGGALVALWWRFGGALVAL